MLDATRSASPAILAACHFADANRLTKRDNFTPNRIAHCPRGDIDGMEYEYGSENFPTNHRISKFSMQDKYLGKE